MTRQLPKPVAVPLGRVIFGAINGLIYTGGQLCIWWDDLCDGLAAYRRAQQLGREAEQWLDEIANQEATEL